MLAKTNALRLTPRFDEPDNTAVRVALWRAMHVEVDAPTHVLEDVVGLQLDAPDANWRARQDMHPLHRLAALAPGSTVAMTFMLPIELVDKAGQPGLQMSAAGARRSGTPFVSFFAPEEIVSVAHEAGFGDASHISSNTLADRYFTGRADGLRPSTGADWLIAST